MFRYSFNTAFTPYDNTLFCSRIEISPEKKQKNYKKLPEDFRVIFEFENFCETCKSHLTKIDDLCDRCKKVMPEEIDNWKMITRILEQHDMPSLEQAKQLIPNQEKFLNDAQLKPIKFSSENFQIDRSVFVNTGKLTK